MPVSEKFAAELIFETKQLKSGIRETNRNLKDFESSTTKLFDQFGKIAEANVKKATTELQKLGDIEVGQKLQDFANTGTSALQSFLGAAGQVEQFRLTLTTLTGSASEAEAELQKLQDFAGSTPFELKDVVAAGVQIRSLGVDVDRFLPLAGDLASVFNRDIKDSALALSKALSGSQDGIQVLQDSFGITKRDLQAAGATIKSTGAIALDSSDDLAALADAIQRVADQKNFTGAINNQLKSLEGNTSQLKDAAFQLAAAIGDSLIPAFIPLVQTATNLVKTIASAPKPVLALVGGVTALATALAGGGAAFLTIRAAVAGITPLLAALPGVFTATAAGATAAGTAATGAGAAFSTMLGPIGLLASLIGGGLLFAITQAEQASIELGNAIAKESQAVNATFGGFQRYRDAVATATGASRDFVNIGQDTETVVRGIRDALNGVSGAKFADELAKAGITYDSLARSTDKARQNQKQFLDQLSEVREERKRLEELRDTDLAGSLNAGQYQGQIDALKDQEATLTRVIDKTRVLVSSQREGVEKLKETNDAYKKVQAVAGQQLAELKIKADTDDLGRSNALLQETSGRITQIKSLLSGQGVDVSSLNAIQDSLAKTSDAGQKASLEGLLALIKERNSLEKQSADITSKATKERVEAALEEARAQDTSGERIAALKQILAEEKNLGDLKKRILSEISREEKSVSQEQKQAQKERIDQAIFEANQSDSTTQQKIANLKRILTQYELEGSVRRRILNDISRAEKQLEQERKQRQQAEAQALSGEYVRQQELLLQSIDDRIAKLREEADAGKDVNAEIQAALQERTDKEVELIQYKTQERADAADSSKVASEIEKTGELEVEAARRKGIDAIEDQKQAQDDRIKKIREERKEALKGIADEKKARDEVSKSTASQDTGAQVKAQAPGQSLSELADELAGVFSPQASKARADEIRGQNQDSSQQQASFAALNPQIAENLAKEQDARNQRIADADDKRRAVNAKLEEERNKKIAKAQEQANEAALSARRADAAGRNEAIAYFNQGQLDPARAAALSAAAQAPAFSFNPLAGATPDPKAIKATPLPTVKVGESAKKAVAQDSSQSAESKREAIEMVIGIEIDGVNVKSASAKRSKGIDGSQTKVERTLNGFNLKVTI